MIDGRKNSLKYSNAGILMAVLLLITSASIANYSGRPHFDNSLTEFQDTIKKPPTRDTIPIASDSLKKVTDTFRIKVSKDSLDAPVNYSAADSMVFDVPNKRIILYSKGKVLYKDIDLSADSIELDQDSKTIVASYRRDSLGNMVGRPSMKQAETSMDADLIRYNIENQKGITQNTYTTQGEIHVTGERFKKVSENVYFGLRGQMSTCNLDTPHFAFRTNKMKLVNQKLAVTGPIHPEFEGVPVPIYLPFGIFPLSSGRHSGLLPPTFTASEQFGLGLEGLGYYKVLSEYFDLTVRTNLYSYGGHSIFLTPTYRKRYRYNGGLNLAYQKTKILTDDPKEEYQEAKTFNITWNHSADSRARPGTTFSASVNAGSTQYNQYVANNNTINFTNQLSSSITYSKTWGTLFNFTASANHNQNNNTRLINLTLPNIAFTMNTLYPFQKKEFTGTPKWYEKLGVGLNTNVSNVLSFYDSAFTWGKMLDTLQWGAQHNVPIQLSLPPLGPVQISPGVSYQEKWYSKQMVRYWNDPAKKVDTIINKGFYTAREVSFSLALSTAIFGTINKFGKNSRVRAIRHVVRPTLSFNYKPDMAGKDYYNTQIDTTGRQFRFSNYDATIYGPFSEGRFGGIGFGIDNNIEAKVRSKKDSTEEGIRKVRWLDGFGFNGGYNFIADSFKLSTISLYARSTIMEKINITAGAVLDPYKVDSSGFRKNEYSWQGGDFSLGRIVSGNIAITANFQSKQKDESKKQETPSEDESLLPSAAMQEQMMQMEYIRQNPAEFVDFNVPWSLSISYSLNFSRQFRSDYSGFKTETFSSFNWNGDFSFTPKWKAGMSGYYDFNTSKIQSLTMFLTREMHCWQLAINITPVGLYRSFNITVNPKSGLLRDLRVNRTRYFYN